MNKTVSNHHTSSGKEHGTTGAYVVGFVLSLIFTIIPYHLVVNKVLTGGTLIAVILGIAVWQMVIQLVFFLHLGRGPKPLYNIVFFFATAGVILITIGASLFIMDNLYRNMSPEEMIRKQAQEENIAQIGGKDTGACNELRQSHIVDLSGAVVRPNAIQASRCDTLTFTNLDERSPITLVFVNSEGSSVSYGGKDTVVIDGGRPETITLNETGTFIFRDESSPGLNGQFIVSP